MAMSLATIAVVVTTVDWLRPEYTLRGSRTITTASLFGLMILGRMIYSGFLYPRFLTPFKNLPEV